MTVAVVIAFNHLQINPKKTVGTSMGFRLVASALALPGDLMS